MSSDSVTLPIVDVSCLTSLCRDKRFYRPNASYRYDREYLTPLVDAVIEHLYEQNENEKGQTHESTGGNTQSSSSLQNLFQSLTLKPAVAACCRALYNSLHRVGFSYISNHSVDLSLQDRIDELAREFFGGRSLDEKMDMAMPKGGKAWRGYFPVGGELTSGKPDIKEGIYFGQKINMKDVEGAGETDNGEASGQLDAEKKNPPTTCFLSSLNKKDSRADDALFGDNLYPTDTPSSHQESSDGKRTIWPAAIEPYLQQCEALGQAMMILIAIALELEDGPLAFIKLGVCDDPLGLFRIFHYPPPATLSDPKLRDEATLWGVGEHTDYGLLTLLKQDNVGGLQVRHRNGSWILAPPIEGTLVVNVGDMLEAITRGLLLSTPHRVKNTDPTKMRISFPYFFDPCVDFVIRPLKLNEKMTRAAKESVEARREMGWSRWDNQLSVDVASMILGEEGLTYGTYLTRKVSKVFPMLAQTQLGPKE